MKINKRVWLVGLLALGLVGAAPGEDADELLRQGNAAFEREDYETAIKAFERAEVLTTDPGRVAFNKAAAYYRLEKYDQATLAYRCALEGATGPRRARGLYNLGNSLVKRAQGNDVPTLQEAIRSYEACVHEGHADAVLARAAGDNLKLAQALLLQARAARKEEPEHKDPQHEDSPPPPRPETNRSKQGNSEQPQPDPQTSKSGQATGDPTDPSQKPIPTDMRPRAGAGQSPLAQGGDATPLSAQETDDLLRRALARIAAERRKHQQHPVPSSARIVKNW